MGIATLEDIRRQCHNISDELIALRHELHQIPEPQLYLPLTAKRIEKEINALGLELTRCQTVTGMCAVLRGKAAHPDIHHRPIVLLRADMDALPVVEETGLEWASTNGNMHGCGHDVHMAGLVGAMRVLYAHREELKGDVVFFFQSGEEGWNGAQYMIDEGMLKVAGRMPDHAYGVHVWSARYPAGFIGTRKGAMMASSDTLKITIVGRGGHGSAPHEVADPVPVLAELILAIQVMITREFDIFDPVVATCGHIHAGKVGNVIPDEAHAEYTLRAFSPQARTTLHSRISELAEGLARSRGMEARIEFIPLYPVTVNDGAEVDFVQEIVEATLPGRWAEQETPMAAAEDFAKILEHIPGCFVGISAVEQGEDHRHLSFNHSSRAHFSDSVIADCSTVLAAAAYQRLTSPSLNESHPGKVLTQS